MKAYELAELLMQNPDAEVLHSVLNLSTLVNLDSSTIITAKKGEVLNIWAYESNSDAVNDNDQTKMVANTDIIILN